MIRPGGSLRTILKLRARFWEAVKLEVEAWEILPWEQSSFSQVDWTSSEFDLHPELASTAQDRELDPVAGAVGVNQVRQRVFFIDWLVIYLLDEVAFLQSRLIGGAARHHLGNPRTLVGAQVFLLGEFLRHHLEADAQERTVRASGLGRHELREQVVHKRLGAAWHESRCPRQRL